jgi:CRP/FNR family transcriptional regulator
MDIRKQTLSATRDQTDSYIVSCKECSLNALCLPAALEEDEVGKLEAIVRRARPLQRNQRIYEIGEVFTSIYTVRSGAIKAFSIDENGEEQVIGFYLPGEIFGLDAIFADQHVSSAKALETSAICELPFDQITALSAELPNLQTHMYKVMSGEIQADQQLQLLLSKKTAEERIGTFLMNLSARYSQRRLSPNSFRLPMARTDIGNYLGLAVETVSRVFTRMQNNNILKVDGKEVSIIDQHRLCEIAHNFQRYN